MKYGPEIITILAGLLSRRMEGSSIQRVDGGKDWTTMKAGKEGIFISWSQDNFGISLTGDNHSEIKSMGTTRGGISLALSKHLAGSKIKKIYQKDHDRILCIDFQKYLGAGVESQKTLVAEFMGRLSNLILLDDEERIIESARHVHPDINRYRTIVPGAFYQGPPAIVGIELGSLSTENLEEYLRSPIGIGRKLASRLEREIDENPSKKSDVVDGLRKIAKDLGGLIIQDIEGYISVWPWLLHGATEIECDGLRLVYDRIVLSFKQRTRQKLINEGKKNIQREIKSLGRHVDGLKKQLSMAEEAATFRLKGEAILSNLESILPRETSSKLTYWDDLGNEITLDVDLDPSLDGSQNAKKYFKKYKKYSCDIKIVSERLAEVESALEIASHQIDTIEMIEDINILREIVSDITPSQKVKNSKKSDPPMLKYEFNESIFLVGLNERSNRHVTFKEAGPNDIWFHVHDAPGSHVIMKNPPKDTTILEQGINIGASLALHYSKNSGKERRFVDYTLKKHVKHIKGAGPSQVTYKESRSINVDHLLWREWLLEKKGDL